MRMNQRSIYLWTVVCMETFSSEIPEKRRLQLNNLSPSVIYSVLGAIGREVSGLLDARSGTRMVCFYAAVVLGKASPRLNFFVGHLY